MTMQAEWVYGVIAGIACVAGLLGDRIARWERAKLEVRPEVFDAYRFFAAGCFFSVALCVTGAWQPRIIHQLVATTLLGMWLCAGIAYLAMRVREHYHTHPLQQDTLRKALQVEHAAKEHSERMFRLFCDHVPGVVLIVDAANTYLYASGRWTDYFGMQPSEIVGKTFQEVWPAPDAARYSRNAERVIQTGDTLLTEETSPPMGTSGDRHWLVEWFPVADAAKTQTLCGIIAIDVTQLRQEQGKMPPVRRPATERVGRSK